MLGTLVGESPAFVRAISQLPPAAHGDGAVLISGETGTGKELIARAIHYLGKRASMPFVAVNCGSLVDTLLESEIFGHERGAFTDAHAKKIGLIAQADGGTLLLDEVDTLTPRAQVALLRVLQDRTYRALGSTREQRVDVRFIAATNSSLTTLIEAGTFRPDLYFRLSVFSIVLPPLRERVDDILVLAAHFIAQYGPRNGPLPRLSTAASAALLSFHWPGNVRELENAIRRALSACRGGILEEEDLALPSAPRLVSPLAVSGDVASFKHQKRRLIEAFERQYLTQLMTRCAGNVSRAARIASKERRDFGKLLKKYGLDPKGFSKNDAEKRSR